MKRFLSVILLIGLAGLALADIPPERRLPNQPPIFGFHQLDGSEVEPPPYARAERARSYLDGLDRPIEPRYDEPQALDESPNIQPIGRYPVDPPPYGDPVGLDGALNNRPVGGDPVGLGAMPQGSGGTVPIIMPPIFRDRIAVHFGPGYGRLYGNVRLYDMNGRLVISEPFEADGGVSIGGARVSSLAAGSYLLEVDCGPSLIMKGKLVKSD